MNYIEFSLSNTRDMDAFAILIANLQCRGVSFTFEREGGFVRVCIK